MKSGIFTSWSRSDVKEMYKKGVKHVQLLSLLNKPIAFLAFSLPSPSSLLKLPTDLSKDANSSIVTLTTSSKRELLKAVLEQEISCLGNRFKNSLTQGNAFYRQFYHKSKLFT